MLGQQLECPIGIHDHRQVPELRLVAGGSNETAAGKAVDDERRDSHAEKFLRPKFVGSVDAARSMEQHDCGHTSGSGSTRNTQLARDCHRYAPADAIQKLLVAEGGRLEGAELDSRRLRGPASTREDYTGKDGRYKSPTLADHLMPPCIAVPAQASGRVSLSHTRREERRLPERAVAPHLELREGERRDIPKAIGPGVTRITE